MTGDWFLNIALSTTLVPPVCGLIRLRKLQADMRLFFYFFTLTLLVESANVYLAKMHHNNLWLINLINLCEGIFMMLVFLQWSHSKTFRKTCIVLTCVYVAVWLGTTLPHGNFLDYNVIEKTLKGLLVTFGCLYLIASIGLRSTEALFNDYRIWMLATTLIYFSTTLIIYATANLLLPNKEYFRSYSYIYYLSIGIVTNLMWGWGFLWYFRTRNSQTNLAR